VGERTDIAGDSRRSSVRRFTAHEQRDAERHLDGLQMREDPFPLIGGKGRKQVIVGRILGSRSI